MRVGVVGCGYWGSKHVRVLSQMSSIASVVAIDQNQARTAALGRQFPALLTADSVEESLDLVDAVIIATPPSTHAALAWQLLIAGKHVLVEKPMTTTSRDALELIALSESLGLVLMAGHTFEYNAAVRYLRDLVAGGDLGRIYYVDAARLNLGLYQPDVNCLWDLAPHDVSVLNYVLDSEPTSVYAWGSAHAGQQTEDVAYVHLEYGHIGVSAQVHVSWLDPCKVRRTTVVGSKRMAVYNDLQADEAIRIYDKGVQTSEQPEASIPLTYRHGDIRLPRINFMEPLAEEDAHFVECVANGTVCRTDGRRGLAVVRVLEAAQESMRTRRHVDLTLTDEPTRGRVPVGVPVQSAHNIIVLP